MKNKYIEFSFTSPVTIKNKKMKNNAIKLIVSTFVVAFSLNVNAKENVGGSVKHTNLNPTRSVEAQCVNASAQVDLDINNVKAKILNGGDMWWDIFGSENARYFVPKPSDPNSVYGPSSQFASSVWVGGYDATGQLKTAAQTYRQSGNDYWPGPLTSAATTDAATCLAWDKFWKINRQDVSDYYNWVISGKPGANPVSSSAMDVINTWPAIGPEGQPLAPYWDINLDNFYEPEDGEIPDFDVTGTRGCSAKLFGDQNIFWVFNDKGNIHTETGQAAIGLEIQAQAFAFQTTDELNNATFYKYKIINKSSFRLDSTFFGVWDDADLGYAYDDYVGCDVGLGLGILYNGDDMDGGGEATSYGANPPAVGVDFFEGPFADPDGKDNLPSSVPAGFLNYGDGIVDNERLGITRFMYFNNNNNTVNGNPAPGDDFYQYLTATWRNGTKVTYGQDGTKGTVPCYYMFPGTSDPQGFGTNMVPQAPWDEKTSGNVPDDRRFLESSGPFKLQPGAVNYITIGVPWARATQGGALASVALMKGADAKAQSLFNNCFAALDGPTAPHLAIQELDRQLILYWTNPKDLAASNNANELYKEDYDKSTGADSLYRFQGYQIYQLKDGTVGISDITNVDKARLVFQCDKRDGISQIVNYKSDLTLSALIPQEMVNGADIGIVHSASITTDKFATGNDKLVNDKIYYYAVVAYGYSSTQVPYNLNQLIDYSPYIAGRKQYDGYFPHSAMPHKVLAENGGTQQNSMYGSGVSLTRLEGSGNGGNTLDLTSETVQNILNSSTSRVAHPTYQNGKGPVTIQVVDPLNVPEMSEFRLLIYGAYNGVKDNSTWDLVNLTTGDTAHSETTIKLPNEQIINGQPSGSLTQSSTIPKWGLSVNIHFAYDPGNASAVNNSALEATMEFADPAKRWLTGLPDQDGTTNTNWIRSGTSTFTGLAAFNDYAGIDDGQDYEKLLGGTWAPYRLCASTTAPAAGQPIDYIGGPAWNNSITMALNKMANLASVDIVITSDKSKWTRCPVIEMQEEASLAIGGAKKMSLRASLSVDKNGLNVNQGGNTTEANLNGTTGMGWFPGYAINLETGERLNMAFGEDSWLANENGADMKWNPTANTYSFPSFDPLFGGKHYIYVFGHNANATFPATDPLYPNGAKDIPAYDQGKLLHDLFVGSTNTYKQEIFSDAMWVNIPMLVEGRSVLETDVKVRLRVTKAYRKYGTESQVASGSLVVGQTYIVEQGPITHNAVTVATGNSFVAVNANYTSTIFAPSVLSTTYDGNPTYSFNTNDIGTKINNSDAAQEALKLINIVPNPYYAYSGYEQKANDNRVRITNLPEKCTISIYALNGTLVRKFSKDDSSTILDWDLKNQARIPIASGMYIIHVDVPNVGEKILKWLGVLRPVDLEAY